MDYQFPSITHINDVLPAIEGSKEFIVAQKEGYTVINYVMAGEETFPPVILGSDDSMYGQYTDHKAALRRECRGLIFCSETGRVLSRGYHKFFNQNEREETRLLDLSKSHVILEKLDGSMIRPLFLKGAKRPRWVTKMGITEVGMQVETWLAENPELQEKYEKLAEVTRRIEFTPIFEWCSRKQRIVLDYPQDQLILTAIRHNYSGIYTTFPVLQEWTSYGIPIVQETTAGYLDQESVEGIVIRFDDGHMVKVKTDWYVLRHKALDGLRSEKNVLKLILQDGLDDVIPLLDEGTKKRVTDYSTNVTTNIRNLARNYLAWVHNENPKTGRRDFADLAKKMEHPWLAFKVYDGIAPEEAIREKISRNLSSQTTVDSIRSLIGANYYG